MTIDIKRKICPFCNKGKLMEHQCWDVLKCPEADCGEVFLEENYYRIAIREDLKREKWEWTLPVEKDPWTIEEKQ